jgi:hypothetical protein
MVPDVTHRYRLLREVVGRLTGHQDLLFLEPDELGEALAIQATVLARHPLNDITVWTWSPPCRDSSVSGHSRIGMNIGIEICELDGMRFAMIHLGGLHLHNWNTFGDKLVAVSATDHEALFRRAKRPMDIAGRPPILEPGQEDLIWRNTIGFLEPACLERTERYGGRTYRGLLFSGPPGTGKTMACRWIQAEAHRRGWETRVVSADTLRTARFSDNADALFHFHDRGLVFLDDMDHPMRERALGDAEDQAVLLTALDGIRTKARVVYVFTSNCPLKNIDSAFLRPGRVDVGVLFTQPGSSLRKRLLATWHPEIRAALDETRFIRATDGYSFAQLDEVRNLMVMSYLVRGVWSLDDALNQLEGNGDFAQTSEPMGFRSEVSAQA